MINGVEYQPALNALIKQGYVGLPQLVNFTINEKTGKGVAIVKLNSTDITSEIYYNKDTGNWSETKPAYYEDVEHTKMPVHPSIIAKHYYSAI